MPLLIEGARLLDEQVDFHRLLPQYEPAVDGAHFCGNQFGPLLHMSQLPLGGAAQRILVFREPRNGSCSFGLQMAEGLFQLVRFPRPTNDVVFSLDTGSEGHPLIDRKSTRLNSSHPSISYAVFCLKKKKKKNQ